MRLRRRPWAPATADESPQEVGPTDAMVLEALAPLPRDSAPLPGLRRDGARFHELPLPVRPGGDLRGVGIPARPRTGRVPDGAEEEAADAARRRMEATLTRVNELGYAADDPMRVWDRLDAFWAKAGEEDRPLVSEIVRQAAPGRAGMLRVLDLLMGRLRRVLRRERALTPLDRVQEMDEASMVWLIRQPGRTLAERAGPSQRVQAIVRRESHDTAENRVLHAWCRLAEAVARDWLRRNAGARASRRFAEVERLRRRARLAMRDLERSGVGVAPPDQTPNFVLSRDPDYRAVYEAWRRLLTETRRLDELWAWQARTWADFCALAVTLSARAIPGAELVASCPLQLRDDLDRGSGFRADTPLAVFHLRDHGLIVEVQHRPRFVETHQDALAAPIWLRIGDLAGTAELRRVPVWPRLVFRPVDLAAEAADCARAIAAVAPRLSTHQAILLHSDPAEGEARAGPSAGLSSGVPVISSLGLAPSGDGLRRGLDAIGRALGAEVEARRARP
ncbi:MAG: hypothetical protein VX463_13610 [Pseudomonadota bacterium]|nr:hypothetical protein [Pseudomonadota bacterium]